MPAAHGSAPPLLRASGLGWRYRRGPWLFQDVSVQLTAGELLRVRGTNGSGKSTLLRLLAGCLEPRRGAVHRAARAAYLPQQARSLPAVPTGRLSALLTGSARTGGWLLEQHLGTRADRLSGGTARRLLLDAALALPTPLLVLDEPTAGLDAAGVDRLAAVLEDRLRSGGAVVLADHQPLPVPETCRLDLGGTPQDPSAVDVVLAGTGAFRGLPARDGVVRLSVPVGNCDALLLEALRSGWSVRRVQPRTGPAHAEPGDR